MRLLEKRPSLARPKYSSISENIHFRWKRERENNCEEKKVVFSEKKILEKKRNNRKNYRKKKKVPEKGKNSKRKEK